MEINLDVQLSNYLWYHYSHFLHIYIHVTRYNPKSIVPYLKQSADTCRSVIDQLSGTDKLLVQILLQELM